MATRCTTAAAAARAAIECAFGAPDDESVAPLETALATLYDALTSDLPEERVVAISGEDVTASTRTRILRHLFKTDAYLARTMMPPAASTLPGWDGTSVPALAWWGDADQAGPRWAGAMLAMMAFLKRTLREMWRVGCLGVWCNPADKSETLRPDTIVRVAILHGEHGSGLVRAAFGLAEVMFEVLGLAGVTDHVFRTNTLLALVAERARCMSTRDDAVGSASPLMFSDRVMACMSRHVAFVDPRVTTARRVHFMATLRVEACRATMQRNRLASDVAIHAAVAKLHGTLKRATPTDATLVRTVTLLNSLVERRVQRTEMDASVCDARERDLTLLRKRGREEDSEADEPCAKRAVAEN